ncbi:MAG: 2-succinyl-5-enolpyruvyl-6-hydroxy-3-cyclohexene-1-carboxylic-acid synthase [Duncaniella sp.]|nr:2-succinyl-5-enolpyruvyl-6-hydroxy-3-cyclohexene-1-carboxylic-acid synthase [Duncaniella sp.]
MVTTDKLNCNILADLLIAHGVKLVIASPGSRNAPLLVALSRRPELRMEMVIDERSAAFIALGAAIESGEPVAVCCTSGTALLNYAPAVAEAYYRGIPLIVVSADRPREWIDQDDSQTIRQPRALSDIVKTETDIPALLDHEPARWMARREINDALAIALSPRRGPAHINIRIDAPLGNLGEYSPCSAQKIISTSVKPSVSDDVITEAAHLVATSPRVMIVAGFMAPDKELNGALDHIARLPGVAILTETVANLHSESFISAIDLALNQTFRSGNADLYRPDIVITLGGALVSRKIKEFLRNTPSLIHWHVGVTEHFVDCFKHLSVAVNADPAIFFTRLAEKIDFYAARSSDFGKIWREAFKRGIEFQENKIKSEGWTDMKAFYTLLRRLPTDSTIHFSNGTPIRYSQLMGYIHFARVECNRGVSGIDGCTSTALGSSTVSPGDVILISGDMSFQYDIAALSSKLLSPRLKMVVTLNSGGGIFRFIESTSRLPEREQFFSSCMNLPLKELAEAYGIVYLHAADEDELVTAIPEFLSRKDAPVILAIETPAEESAVSLRSYFESK